ncbi:tyrosine-type recombinase/integrase [Aromatoleum toluolicum]|uniref:Tyrosine-type recombinase/integrase n=1 Tax=Aromatoleum toluolicum TaxID=90060 RepID=A0ABX1NHS3_9RHOO|nr:site-specific integrase [Aromatoleum toluolicum]NMF98819.1 tyrosine-type recombinase/integrase [Aromatoleum toluolicum]
MSYLTFHHNSFYFQIRVPTALAATFGPIIRINLQTSDRATARPIALRLASDWLSRFDVARGQVLAIPAATYGPSAVAIPSPTHAASMMEVVPYVGGAAPDCTELATSGRSTTRIAERATDSALFDTWKSIDRGREPSTVREMQASIREFRRFCKAPAPELSRQDVAGFRDHLLGKGQARATVSKKVGFISTLLQVGFDAGVLPQNVARGLKIPRAKVPTLVRRVFTTDELKRIFGSEVYTRQYRPIAGGGEACAWLPMIALVTGARLEEIAQLRTDDIRIDAAHGPLMRITDEDPDQHLKTDGSRRMVPLHADAVRAGFLDYVDAVRDARQKWLFPDLERDHDGRRGGNFGKWFGRYLRSRRGLGISDPRVVFHCFRHTFKTLCRAALIPEDVHDALTGHVSSSVSRKYGEMPLGPLVAAIAAVKLPIALPRVDV